MMTNSFLLFRRIYNHYKNLYLELQRSAYPKLMKRLNEFFEKQNIWIRKQIVRFPNDPLWRHVNYVITQLDGLMAGYRSIKQIVSTYIFLSFNSQSSSYNLCYNELVCLWASLLFTVTWQK